MASLFGLGFGRGALGSLSQNIDEGKKLDLLRAQLLGDIAGNEDLLTSEERGLLTPKTGTGSTLRDIFGSFGLTKPGGNIEEIITAQRSIQARAKREQADRENYKEALAYIKSGVDLDPEKVDLFLKEVKRPERRFFLEGALRLEKDKRAKIKQIEEELQKPDLTPRQKQQLILRYNIITGHPISGQALSEQRPIIRGTPQTGITAIHPETLKPTEITPATESPAQRTTRELNEIRIKRLKQTMELANDPKATLGQLSASLNALLRERDSIDTPPEEKAEISQAIRVIRQRITEIGSKAGSKSPSRRGSESPSSGLPPGWRFAD